MSEVVVNADQDLLFDHLPPEIISTIFSLVVDHRNPWSELQSRNPVWYTSSPTPYTLAAVARRWRSVAIATPDLWTYFRFCCTHTKIFTTTGRYPLQDISQIVENELQRSGGLPLHIIVDISALFALVDRMADVNEFILNSVASALNEHSKRWKTFFLSVPPTLLQLFKGNGTPASILEHLSISTFSDRMSAGDGEFRLLNVWPTPTKVKICQVSVQQLFLDWSLVDELHFVETSSDLLWDFLQVSPRLEKLTIQRPRYSRGHRDTPAVHPHLRELTVYSAIGFLFGFFNLPCLTSLRLHHFSGFEDLTEFFERSGCNIQYLEMVEFEDMSSAFTAILRSLPTLKVLVVRERRNKIPRLFDQLILHSEHLPPLLPALEELRYEISGIPSAIPWHLIPSLSLHGAVESHDRPLRILEIKARFTSPEVDTELYIEEEDLDRLSVIDDNWFQLRVVDTMTGTDFIKISRNYHEGLRNAPLVELR